jgi:hypothetical protein
MEPTWAKIMIMGHREHYGLVSEVERFGVRMALVQVPSLERPGEWAVEHVYGGAAVFGMFAMTQERVIEELLREAEWNAPRALPAHEHSHDTERTVMNNCGEAVGFTAPHPAAIDTDPDAEMEF